MSLFTIERAWQLQNGNIDQLFIIFVDTIHQEKIDALCQRLTKKFISAAIVVVKPGSDLFYQHYLSEQKALTEKQLLEFVQLHTNDISSFIQPFQRQLSVDTSATAVIGMGQIGSLVLELAKRNVPLAGRLISFGSRFAQLPVKKISLEQTIHLLCATKDPLVSCVHTEQAKQAITDLDGDATIDIGHALQDSFSESLQEKMMERLLACVPLRYFKEAQEELMSNSFSETIH